VSAVRPSRRGLVALSSFVFAAGCAARDAALPGAHYDEQGCVEHALRSGPDPDTVAAARVAFEKACIEGRPEACSALGVVYEVGLGVPSDPVRAVELYDLACRSGNVRGCTNLAVARVEGIGGLRDERAGAAMLDSSCDRGDARACLYLGRLHDAGDAPPAERALAARLLEFACDGQEAGACVARAESLARAGRYGDALAFYGKACSLGDARACAFGE
jgi:TPR repeat protein